MLIYNFHFPPSHISSHCPIPSVFNSWPACHMQPSTTSNAAPQENNKKFKRKFVIYID